MGFSFLTPLFLAGFSAIAIPVIIHLTHRQRREPIAFPSLMFLRRIPYRTARRQRIRHWLLFLIRSLVIVIVVAAFARPLLDSATGTAAAFTSAREVVILLDRSHSMGYGDRWGRALDAARSVTDDLGPEDRATLVLFSERADAVTQPTADRAVLNGALEAAEPGYGVTRYGPALQLAREIIERGDRPRSEVVLVTDFQKAGWDARQMVRLPEGTALTSVDLSDPRAVNLAVTSVALARERSGDRERAALTARLANTGGESLTGVTVVLDVDGERLQTQTVALDAGESATLQFDPFLVSSRPVRGVLRAGDDALPGDNAFYFIVAPDQPLSVLIVEPRGAVPHHSLYLQRALEVGGRPGFHVDVGRVTRLNASQIDGRAVVILNDAPFPTGAAGASLRELIERGGGLLVVLGRRSPAGAWPAEGLNLLPASFGGPIDRSSADGGTLGYLDYDHPVYSLFRTPRSGDFTGARFFRYRRLAVKETGRALARFDDGSVALAAGRQGEGEVLVWASDLENFWNDLAVQPVFLPFVHQLVKHLSQYEEPRAWHRVGEVIDITQNSMLANYVQDDEVEIVVESPSGARSVLNPEEGPLLLRLDEVGFYEVRVVGRTTDRSFAVAANLDPLESDLTSLDPQELVAATIEGGTTGQASLEAVVLSAEERERRQGLWWYLLMLAAGLLVTETLLSNHVSRRVRQST